MSPWGIAALIAVAAMVTKTGRACAKNVFRSSLRAGCQAKESACEMASKATTYKDDLIAEIRAEDDQLPSHQRKGKKKTKVAAE